MKLRYFIILILFQGLQSFSQRDTLPLYKRFPTVPPLHLLLADSTTFTDKNLIKNKPVLLIVFSPDCDHCQKQTEELINRMDEFKSIQIVMATTLPFEKLKSFYEDYRLNRFKDLIVGWDYQLILPSYYHMKSLPFLAFYNKKGKLIDVFEGSLPLSKVIKIFQEHP